MIAKGTVLHKEKPIIYVVDCHYQETHCDYCLNRTSIKYCTACNYVGYCDRECQKKGWALHKYECRFLLISEDYVSNELRLHARIIRLLKKTEIKEKFFNLDSRLESFKHNEIQMSKFKQFYSELSDFLGNEKLPDEDETLEIYSRIHINTFTIVDIDLQHIGCALYLFPKTLKHSCKPNASYVFYGQTMIITALENLTDTNWELSLNYIDPMQSTEQRKSLLKEKYFIDCNCEKCQTPVSDVMCPNKDCQGACNIDEDSCQRCGKQLSSDYKNYYKEVLQFLADNVNLRSNQFNFKLLNLCVKKMRKIFHPTHHLYIKILEKLYIFEENNRHWLRSMNYLKEIITGYEHHYSKFSFGTGALYYKMAKLSLCVDDNAAFFESMKTVKEIFYVLYGDEGQNYVKDLSRDIIQVLTRPEQSSESD